MPFALIPDGFTLQKVTAAQERAVKSKRRQDDLIALINNPQTIGIIGTIIGGALVATQVDNILKLLKESGVQISDDVEKETKQTVSKTLALSPFVLPFDVGLGLAGKIDSDLEKQLRELIPGL